MVSFSTRGTVGAKQLTKRKKHSTKQAINEKHITQEEVEVKESSHRPLDVIVKKGIKLGSSLKDKQAKILFR